MWVVAGAVVLLPLSAFAASLQISPVSIDMSASQSAAAITLTNPGSESLYGQVRVFKWDQDAQGERLMPATDLIASPPLIEVAPGQNQVVRLVRPRVEKAANEASYRLLIDEIAPAAQTDISGVVLRLRYSVPVFVSARGITEPDLTWLVVAGTRHLQVRNAGRRRAQIAGVQLVQGNRIYELERGLLGYALARRTRQWPLTGVPPLAAGLPLRVKAQVNGKPIEAPVVHQP
jgi:fimbrial chaperone protein